jgi:hypothetical protein
MSDAVSDVGDDVDGDVCDMSDAVSDVGDDVDKQPRRVPLPAARDSFSCFTGARAIKRRRANTGEMEMHNVIQMSDTLHFARSGQGNDGHTKQHAHTLTRHALYTEWNNARYTVLRYHDNKSDGVMLLLKKSSHGLEPRTCQTAGPSSACPHERAPQQTFRPKGKGRTLLRIVCVCVCVCVCVSSSIRHEQTSTQ